MTNEFIINLAANLVWEWLKTVTRRLLALGFGDDESRALQRAFQSAFEAMLSQTVAPLEAEQQHHLESVLHSFISDEQVAGAFLEAALRGQPPPLDTLRERLATLGLDEATLPISLDTGLTALCQALEEALKEEASKAASPLFNRLTVTRIDEVQRQLQEIIRRLDAFTGLQEALQALQEVERVLGQRTVSITGDVSGSIIITGDGNTIHVSDGGQVAQLWQELQISDVEAKDRYREQVADLYAHLSFPLSGLSFDTLVDEVYQPLQVAPVRDLANWRLAEHAALHERREADELLEVGQPMVLLGMLGGGKTTALHYLTWAYARRPKDRLLWRGDELVPFYLTARDLADAWQGEAEFVPACARAVIQARHHPPFSVRLAQRVLQSAVEQGNALLLIDALDEYRAPDTTRYDFLRSLHSIWQADPIRNNLLLLTSRPHAYLQTGFRAYALQVLESLQAERLAYRLGKVLLRERGDSETEQRAKLNDLTRLVVSPQMRDFASPFYVTLLTLAICRSERFADGLAQAQRIARLADLYRFFLRQTIRWEQAKPDAPAVDEHASLLMLAELGWQTFVEPPWQERLLVDLLSDQERRTALSFWQRTGLLQQDEFSGEWMFYHSGFQLFGVAMMLKEAWGRGRREEIQRLQKDTLHLADWETVWELFSGLLGGQREHGIPG